MQLAEAKRSIRQHGKRRTSVENMAEPEDEVEVEYAAGRW
jgi:hypothetical protein